AGQLKGTKGISRGLPGTRAKLRLHWPWTAQDPGNLTNFDVLAFKDVEIDPGALLNKVLGPMFQQVARLFKPLKPLIDTIRAPIPVLSDLSHAVGGGDVTLLTRAATFSTNGDGWKTFDKFVKIFGNIVDLASRLGNDPDCEGCVKVGDFEVLQDAALRTANSPDVAESLIGAKHPFATSPIDQVDSYFKSKHSDQPDLTDSDNLGLTFPGFSYPKQIFGLLLGQDARLVRFD